MIIFAIPLCAFVKPFAVLCGFKRQKVKGLKAQHISAQGNIL